MIMNVFKDAVGVITTALTLMDLTSVPVGMGSSWHLTNTTAFMVSKFYKYCLYIYLSSTRIHALFYILQCSISHDHHMIIACLIYKEDDEEV